MKEIATALLVMLLIPIGIQSAYAESDEAIEEIVVTGSYLKRNAQDSPSPLSVITSADIQDLGAADVAEIIQAMPWASGSQTRAATFGGEGADGRGSINLRNLGHGSTLPLVNGKRQVPSWYNGRGNASVNVNGLIPNIALERVEIVKDGASALYGSDAVAGVVNFITKKDFEGFDIDYQYTVDDETGEGAAHTIGIIWGVQGDRGGIVVSASNLNRDEINVDDNYGRFGGSSVSLTGQPGRLVPISGQTIRWAANGARPGEIVDATIDGGTHPRNAAGTSFGQADVNCEDSAALERGGALGVLGPYCVYDFGSFFAIQAEESLRKIHVDGHYDLTDNFEVYFEFAANDSDFDRLNSLNPNAPALTIPTQVPYLDAAGNQAFALNPGSQEDAFRRGIEPIEYSNVTRLLGGTRNTPKSQRPLNTFTNATRSDQRYLLGGTWDLNFGDNAWTLDVSYTASQHFTGQTEAQDTNSSHMELAINGLGGPNCDVVNGTPGEGNSTFAATGNFDDGGCYFFNPFGSSQHNRDGSLGQTDQTLVNPDELYEWLGGRFTYDLDFRQRVIDVVFAGELFQTNSGPIGLALGFQRRRDSGQAVFDGGVTSNNLDFAFGAADWSGNLTTTAVFAEVAIPIGDMLEVNVAGRYEDFDEIGEDTFDPKISILFRPTDSLSIRASAGSSFRVPSLQQSFGSITTVANQVDLVGGTAFKPSLSVGNPNLTPESADNINFGFSWVPTEGLFEGLSIDLDYYDYDYKDIITREASATLLSEDNAALAAYATANLGGSCAVLADCYIDAVNAGVGNRRQVIRNSQGIMVRLLPDFANANGADISGIDFNGSYRFDTDFGTWRVGLQAAWIDTYEVEVPLSAGGTQTFDAVGNYNSQNPVARPLPEWKVNGTLGWSMDQHRAFLIVKYVDEVATDIPAGTRGFYAATTRLAGNGRLSDGFLDDKIDDFTTFDIQYTYTLGETSFLSDASVSLGIQNVSDEEAPVVATTTAFDGTLHDGRGRIFFVRLSASM